MRPRLARRFVSMAKGEPEAMHLAEAGRAERDLEIALRDRGRRPRELRQAARSVSHRDQERADEREQRARRQHEKPDHQRAGLLGPDAEHLLLHALTSEALVCAQTLRSAT